MVVGAAGAGGRVADEGGPGRMQGGSHTSGQVEGWRAVAVDGPDRCSCLLVAIPKLKASGLLVVDNTDKDRSTT